MWSNLNMIKISRNQTWYKNFLDNGFTDFQLKKLSKRWREISRTLGIEKMEDIFEIDIASLISGKNFEISNNKNVVQGTKDGGIDVIYHANDKWFFIQVKMKKYQNSYIEKMVGTFNHYFEDLKQPATENNKGLMDFKNTYINTAKKGHKVEFIFVGLEDNADEKAQQTFKDEKYDVKVFSYNELFRLMASTGVDKKDREESLFTINVPRMAESILSDHNFAFKGIMGIIDAEELVSQFMDLNEIEFDNIFNMNIRNKVTNKKFLTTFKETIKNEPDNFHLYNNGLTIVSQKVNDEHKYGRVIITDPQIINGQQTFRALMDIYRENIDIEVGKSLNGIKIPIKVIEETNQETIKKIARFSNNQTAVKEAELKFSTEEYDNVVMLAKSMSVKLSGKKGKRDADEYVSILSEGGEVKFNEVIRAHAASYYPSEFLGSSKNSISTIVNKYFKKIPVKNPLNEADKSKLVTNSKYNSLIKKSNFRTVLKAIADYSEELKTFKYNKVAEYKKQGKKSKEYNKLVNIDLNPYKYGISVFYYLDIKYPNINRGKALKYIYETDAKGNMNWYKNDDNINISLEYIKKHKSQFV